MRQLLALILLAGTAAPALAAGEPGDRSGRHRETGTQAASEDRGARVHVDRGNRGGDDGNQTQTQRATHVDSNSGGNSGEHRSIEPRGRFSGGGPQPATQVESNSGGSQPPATHVESNSGNQGSERRFHNRIRSRISSGDEPRALQPASQTEIGPADSVRRWRGPKIIEAPQPTIEDRSAPTLRQSEHRVPSVFRNRVPIVSNTPREGTQPTARTEGRRHNWVQWSTSHWRNDRKYDWKDHRRRHRSLFHLGFYYDPFGWNYRPYQIGWRLWPSYYSNRFWINDTWQYRLPYAPPGYRWVRYYDDAILIDTWDGRVVDVIYNFFW